MNETTPINQSILNKSRKDKFLMVFDVPKIIADLDRKNERTNETIQRDSVQFSIQGTVLPPIRGPHINANYRGGSIALASQARPAYDPIQIKFTVDNRFNNYWVFFTWLKAIRNIKDGLYATAVDENYRFDPGMLLPDYTTDMTVYVKDEYDKDILRYTYVGAFPTELQGVDYDYQSPQEIQIAVTLAFTMLELELLGV